MVAVSLETYDRLVNRVYEAAMHRSRWQALIDDLGRIEGGARVALHAHAIGEDHNLGCVGTHAEEFRITYAEHHSAVNPWAGVLARAPLHRVSEPESLLPRDRLLRTEFYNDWLRPQGLLTATGIVLQRDPNRFLALTADIEGAHEARVKPALARLLERLAPHLARALQLMQELALSPLDEAPGDVAAAVFLLDSLGRLTDVSANGEAMLRSGEVVAAGQDLRLHFVDHFAQERLQRALAGAAEGRLQDASTWFTLPAEEPVSGGLRAVITPCRRPDSARDRALSFIGGHLPALRIVLNRTAPAHHLDILAQRLRLSPAEQRIAVTLFAGGSLADCARERGISIHTARNQLKSLMAKAGATRQSQLVAMFASLLSEGK